MAQLLFFVPPGFACLILPQLRARATPSVLAMRRHPSIAGTTLKKIFPRRERSADRRIQPMSALHTRMSPPEYARARMRPLWGPLAFRRSAAALARPVATSTDSAPEPGFPRQAHEFSFVTGFTCNFLNTATDYQNDIDWYLDWGASQFVTPQLQVGSVGYFYKQITADQGCLPALCPFESQVIGVGPQIGYIFPLAGMQAYVNLKAYGEFDGHDRPSGWDAWLTLVLSPAPPAASSPPMLTKAH
jgi:Putative MetA-pathway of phenol degradation